MADVEWKPLPTPGIPGPMSADLFAFQPSPQQAALLDFAARPATTMRRADRTFPIRVKPLQARSSTPVSHRTSRLLYRKLDASDGDTSSACAMNSSASRTWARSAGPPRHTRTASGGVSPVTKASLATSPIPVVRMCPANAARVHGAGSDSHR